MGSEHLLLGILRAGDAVAAAALRAQRRHARGARALAAQPTLADERAADERAPASRPTRGSVFGEALRQAAADPAHVIGVADLLRAALRDPRGGAVPHADGARRRRDDVPGGSLAADVAGAAGTRSSTSASVSGKWQAARLPPSLASSGGSSVRQTSCAFQQRVWKRQPGGGLVGDGTSPVSTWRFLAAASRGSATGTADISAPV